MENNLKGSVNENNNMVGHDGISFFIVLMQYVGEPAVGETVCFEQSDGLFVS
jgi:hypothetical protein|tara:strand:- start:870 stop:1025 length:156 start_codon:yes stop_codon:yes gene_type:complete